MGHSWTLKSGHSKKVTAVLHPRLHDGRLNPCHHLTYVLKFCCNLSWAPCKTTQATQRTSSCFIHQPTWWPFCNAAIAEEASSSSIIPAVFNAPLRFVLWESPTNTFGSIHSQGIYCLDRPLFPNNSLLSQLIWAAATNTVIFSCFFLYRLTSCS